MKLKIEKLTKSFDGNSILKDVSLFIDNFKILAILGPSGGGKSTLLRLIAGLDKPDSGSISINDQPIIFEDEALRKHRRTIGVVFQSFNLFPHLTILENIELPLYRVHQLPLHEAKEIAMQFLKRFDLSECASKKPFQLSGGQRQRVAIVRAIATKVKFLLLDEPTSALDPLMTSEVLDLIMESQKDGINIVLISHHIGFVKKIVDWVTFLDDGKILETTSGANFFSNPKTLPAQRFLEKVLKY
jgi:polar amino acid transport system ATP-binding protein